MQLSAESSVHIRDLRFRYPGATQDTLQIPALDVSGRGLIALTGPSGAGKSTLIELLAGTLREPYMGSVRVLGAELRELTRDADRQRHIRRIGLIPQDYGLLPGRTIQEVLQQDLADAQVPTPEYANRIARALAQVGLSDFAQRPSERLSGGQRQRVAIARMLARDVDLVIADEPTANLDPELVGETLALFRTLGNRVAVIIVTHDGKVAAQCDRTIVLQAATALPYATAGQIEQIEQGGHGLRALVGRLEGHPWMVGVASAMGAVLIAGLIAGLIGVITMASGTGGNLIGGLFGSVPWAQNQQQPTPTDSGQPGATSVVYPATQLPLPTTTISTSSGTTVQGFTLASDQSSGYEYQPPTDPWWIAVSCVPESDPQGSVAVHVLDSSGNEIDFGLIPCDGVSHMYSVGGSYGTVEVCEDSDFGPAPVPTGYVGPAGTACQDGAVKWTLVTPVEVMSGPFGWG